MRTVKVNKEVVKEGSSNYWAGKVVRGGRLFLRADALAFVPHSVERTFGGKPLEVPIGEITQTYLVRSPTPFHGFKLPWPVWVVIYVLLFPFSILLVAPVIWIARSMASKWLAVDAKGQTYLFLPFGASVWKASIDEYVYSRHQDSPELAPYLPVTGAPPPLVVTQQIPAVRERLAELQRLLAEDLITQEDFDSKKSKLLDEL
ncbi:MAG: hypothetical protein ABIP58_02475 [Dehalococcoidia bacterium]